VVFEEGEPHHTLPSVGENIPLFDTALGTLDEGNVNVDQHKRDIVTIPESHTRSDDQHVDIPTEPIHQMEPIQQPTRRSSHIPQPSTGIIQSREYQQREEMGRHKGEEWMTNQWQTQARITINSLLDEDNYIACLAETKASHNIPQFYRHAMSTNLERWMVPMQTEMDTLKVKHT